jgi:4-amino-4-deoxy-L-arabinose transferase-like glycosyltransferase
MAKKNLYRLYSFFARYFVAFTLFLALALRIVLTSFGSPVPNSDEGTMGLEALHIAFRGEHPVFFYGQHYMGVIEAYIGALAYHIFGFSLISLRLSTLFLFTLFFIAIYFLAKLLYSRRVALVTSLLLSFASADMFIQELRAVGGAVETLLFGTATLLFSTWLALHPQDDGKILGFNRRSIVYASLGLVMGLGVWSHTLVLPFILAGIVMLCCFCLKDMRTFAPLILIGLFVVGVSPLIIHTILHKDNVFATALNIQGGSSLDTSHVTIQTKLVGTFLYGLPVATGLSPLCTTSELPGNGPATSHTLPCVLVHGSWSIGYLVLLFLSLWLSIVPLWKLSRRYRAQKVPGPSQEREQVVLSMARCLLIMTALSTLILYASSPLTALKPWSTRYLVGLLVAIPALLWPLLLQYPHIEHSSSFKKRLLFLTKSLILAVIFATWLLSTILTFSALPSDIAANQRDQDFIHYLESQHIKHFYAGYWTCYRLMFMSQEHFICDGPDWLVQPQGRRYPPYRSILDADPSTVYVFSIGSADDQTFMNDYAHTGKHYMQFTYASYHIYRPIPTSA